MCVSSRARLCDVLLLWTHFRANVNWIWASATTTQCENKEIGDAKHRRCEYINGGQHKWAANGRLKSLPPTTHALCTHHIIKEKEIKCRWYCFNRVGWWLCKRVYNYSDNAAAMNDAERARTHTHTDNGALYCGCRAGRKKGEKETKTTESLKSNLLNISHFGGTRSPITIHLKNHIGNTFRRDM